MNLFNFNKFIKIIFFNFFILLFSNLNLFASDIKSIDISGNSRISNETIITFLPFKIGDEITDQDLNIITKDLYSTNFFENIIVKFENNKLDITVVENPIIQEIIYNGIKSDSLKQLILRDVNLIPRSSFNKVILDKDILSIQSNLKKMGYYFSNISAQLENLNQNRVNIIYDIDLGDKAKISKITFVGNKIFKDKKLRSVILSEEYKFWKFLSGKKFLNEDIVNFDKNLLTNFYKNEGYYNVQVSSSFAKLINNEEFELIFNIDSGEKLFFGDLIVDIPINYDIQNFNQLQKTLNKLKGKPYSINSIKDITEEIDLLALSEQYEAINVSVLENIVDNNLNITFKINETQKSFISKINIFGNNITRENVIRNQLEIDEGDFYNEILLNKSINNIKSLNFFKSVKSEINLLNDNNDKDINIYIEEKATGEIGASAGVGTSGNSVGFFVNENNYLGRGLSVQSSLSLSTESVKGLLSINNPNYNDSDKSVYARLEALETDRLKESGYKTNRTGISFGSRFELLDDFEFGLGTKNFYQDIETDSTASALQRKQEGNYWDTFLNFDFIYDKRNQKFKTNDGFLSSYNIELPLLSDTNTFSNAYSYKYFTELYNDNITSFSFYAKSSHSISGDDIKLTERNFLPSNRLRGFGAGKVGPKDGNDFIGGNYASSINISSTLPQFFSENQNLDFLMFLDAGNVWGVDYDSSIDDGNKIRSSTGIGVDWLTPIGPLNFSLSQVLTKTSTDSTETFRFNLGTTF